MVHIYTGSTAKVGISEDRKEKPVCKLKPGTNLFMNNS